MAAQVLRWYGYFCEMVALSAIETYRIRHVTMHFYLSDDTLEVVEPREENSGMSQVCSCCSAASGFCIDLPSPH